MTYVTLKKVNYYQNSDFYTVGNNETSVADGIEDKSYSGEIIIEEKIKGKTIIEISQYAFKDCLITKVTIYAKLRSINYYAFYGCEKLEYINIPSTVTFLGRGALFLCKSSVVCDLEMFIEFNKGRKQNLQ